ncbi:DUF308 domain-containing protein [Cellulomonas sp. NPDC089187]|uniref:HdeD family acid-resistance protein n=1 Tax=Cellulomonas sp. NPDC089187 TaxID=3154970 RepID=UPI00343CF859
MDVNGRISALLGRVWWMPVLRGVLLVVLGLLMLVEPLRTLDALGWIYGLFAVADGLVVLAQAFLVRGRPGLGWWVAEAVVSIAFGVLIMLWPGLTALVLFYLLALWALVVGIVALIVAATQFRARDLGWVGTLMFGLVAFLFGAMLAIQPQESLTVVVAMFGLFALISGMVMIVAGFVTRSFGRQLKSFTESAASSGSIS